MTPDGFLVCKDVVVARTGTQEYLRGEIPVESGPSGKIIVTRDEAEVFKPEAISSFEGKPVTLGHPLDADGVTAKNWREYAVGFTRNVRRGTGDQSQYLVADLVIGDETAITLIQNGLREVSCGYDAGYDQEAPGKGRQVDILGNHIALVEKGRCGDQCAIKDEEPNAMKQSIWAKIRNAVSTKDKAALDAAYEEALNDIEPDDGKKTVTGDEDATAKRMDALESKLDKVVDAVAALTKGASKDDEPDDDEKGKAAAEGVVKDDEPDDEGADGKKKTGDAATADCGCGGKTGDGKAEPEPADATVISMAEILAPGKTFTGDALAVKRSALKAALEGDFASNIQPLMLGKTADALEGDSLHATFVGAAQIIRTINNRRGVRDSITPQDFGRPSSIAEINKQAREYWAGNRS